MTIRVNDPAMPHLPGEVSVTLGDKYERINIHPWDRGADNVLVYVAVGDLKKSGFPVYRKKNKDNGHDGEDYRSAVFPREDFIEALLAVFPELRRA